MRANSALQYQSSVVHTTLHLCRDADARGPGKPPLCAVQLWALRVTSRRSRMYLSVRYMAKQRQSPGAAVGTAVPPLVNVFEVAGALAKAQAPVTSANEPFAVLAAPL